MRLSRESRYAIRALMELARHAPGERVDARHIAAEARLPVAFLQKILRQLTVAGILESRRGQGYMLARPPEAITLRETLEAIEGNDVFGGRCIFWKEECSSEDPCELHFRWRELKPAVEDAIARTTLAEIVEAGGPPFGLELAVPPSGTVAG
ncbi:MAG TPA: Rrf2 family transcriptional regulator [Actinomycetota bacterium]